MKQDICKLLPLVGMEWNGQSIRFGDGRETVEAILGAPQTARSSCYYFENELRFDFDAAGSLEFIECLGGPDGAVQPEIYGTKAFQRKADELLELLTVRNDGPIDDREAEYSYAFLNISVGICRDTTPADVEEMVRELSRIDLTTLGHVNLEEENRRANHWATVGIGRKGYYA